MHLIGLALLGVLLVVFAASLYEARGRSLGHVLFRWWLALSALWLILIGGGLAFGEGISLSVAAAVICGVCLAPSLVVLFIGWVIFGARRPV